MPHITGTILLIQEGRLRLLTEDGRGALFVLAPDAPMEPQDLAGLAGRRVRVTHTPARGLAAAGIAHDVTILDGKDAPA